MLACRFAGMVAVACLSCALPMVASAQPPVLAELEEWFVELAQLRSSGVVAIARIPATPAATVRSTELDRLAPPLTRSLDDQLDAWLETVQPDAFGTGILLPPANEGDEPRILTTCHVARGAPRNPQTAVAEPERLLMQLSNGRRCAAEILAADPRSDLAVLKPVGPNLAEAFANLKPIPMSEGDLARKGQFVLLLGNPYAIGRDGSASLGWGMIGNVSRRAGGDESTVSTGRLAALGTLYQLDAKVSAGMSGCAVLDLRGELIGVGTALAALSGYDLSTGFAIPVNRPFRRIVESLAAGHEVEYGLLGIETATLGPADVASRRIGAAQSTAAVVSRVLPGSPAELAGLRSQDLLLTIAGETILSGADVMRVVGLHAPEEVLDVRYWRPSSQDSNVTQVVLGKWPVGDNEDIIATVPRYPAWRGILVDYPTARTRYLAEPRRFFPAVLTLAVEPDSPAARLGLQAGDFISHVNGVPVTSPREFQRVVEKLTDDASLTLVDGRMIVVPQSP